MKDRKQQTRRKIELGGLIVRVGLQDESTAVLYGMLLESVEFLAGPASDEVRTGWKILGDLAFSTYD